MEVNPANRREKIISLTETGKQYARELVLPLFQSEEEAAAQFTEQEMTEVIRMQEKFDRKDDKKYSLEYYRRMGIAHENQNGKDYYMVVLER